MTDARRRKFLQYSAAVGGGLPLVGCGGGNSPALTETAAVLPGADATAAPKPPVPAPPPPPPPPPTPPPPVETGAPLGIFAGVMQFMLLSTKTQSKAPYCLGYAFRRGDIPAGSSVGANISGLQVISRTTWPDGSLKFAQLAGVVDVTAGSAVVVRLHRAGAVAAGTALGLADLKKTGVTAEFGAGILGTASFGAADWDAPHTTWASGPQMSSWIFRKPFGTDPHLVAWLEVRLFAGGAVEVLPWIENGYLQVAGPTNKSATFVFTLGGRQRFSGAVDLPHHCRTPLISGTVLSYWLGDDPGVTPRHDAVYLQSTEQVPTYSARVAASTGVAQGLATSFAPLQKCNLLYDGDSMPATGYQEPIGLLPQHDVLYLTSDVANNYAAVVRNGFAAGRYPIHYRDEKTQRPLRFSSYPSLVLHPNSPVRDIGSGGGTTPSVGGTRPPVWDCAHSPSVGYMAYLVTGRWYFMEQVQFAATINFLTKDTGLKQRRGSLNLTQTDIGAWQTRSSAWDMRSLVQALAVTPESDSVLHTEFRSSVEANVQFFHATYVAKPNNPWGWVLPGEGYDNILRIGASWQQDFVTAVFGYTLSLGLPISADHTSKLDAFFRWKAQSIISRLGPANAFWYINAAPYTMVISPASRPDYENGTGPWYATAAEVYAATYVARPAWLGAVDGQLASEIYPGERSFWGNLMPAIAYAVRHGVSGALPAYNRVTQASNWPVLQEAFSRAPVWSVAPARLMPAWLANKPLNEWFEIPGTAGAGGAAIDAFSGMAFNEISNEILIAAAGGHNDSADNRVVSLNLAADAPSWKLRLAASSGTKRDVAYYADGKPASRHLYSSLHFVPQVNRLMLFGARAVYGSAVDYAKIDSFNLDTNTWDPAGTWPDAPPGVYGAALNRSTGEVLSTQLSKWSPQSKAWTHWLAQRTDDSVRWPLAVDTKRNQVFTLQWGDGQGYDPARLSASRAPLGAGPQKSVRFNPGAALDQWLAEQPSYAALDYDADNDRFLFYAGQGSAAGRVYVVTPNDSNVWDMSLFKFGAGSVKPSAVGIGGVHNRFRYVPALHGFVLLANGGSNLYFLRTA